MADKDQEINTLRSLAASTAQELETARLRLTCVSDFLRLFVCSPSLEGYEFNPTQYSHVYVMYIHVPVSVFPLYCHTVLSLFQLTGIDVHHFDKNWLKLPSRFHRVS